MGVPGKQQLLIKVPGHEEGEESLSGLNRPPLIKVAAALDFMENLPSGKNFVSKTSPGGWKSTEELPERMPLPGSGWAASRRPEILLGWRLICIFHMCLPPSLPHPDPGRRKARRISGKFSPCASSAVV